MYDKKSFLKGLALGLAGKPLEFAPGKEPVLGAGLYETDTDNLIYSWEQLLGDEILEGGVIHVTDGEVRTNHATLKNKSAEYLNGDLVMPKDGSITSIGVSAFQKCNGLTHVEIPNGVISIGDNAFYGCGLTYVEIPDGVTSVGHKAFGGCTQLTGIYIPESVETIGELWDSMGYAYGTFADCPALTSIRLPAGLTFIDSGMFHNCSGLSIIDIPDSVTVIGVSAFQECVGITSIVIPEGVTEIMRVAFHGCLNLTRIVYNGTTEQWNAMTLGSGWNEYVPATEIICADGTASL